MGYCIGPFAADWLYRAGESKAVVRAMNAAAARVSFGEVESDKGHDAFLLDEPEMFTTLGGFLQAAAMRRGLA